MQNEELTTAKLDSADGAVFHSAFIIPRSSFLLGLFILFQLVYLPTANAIKLIALRLPESKGELDDDIQLRGQAFGEPLQTVADALGTSFVRYGELTGQAQGWSLFAPQFGHCAALPAMMPRDMWWSIQRLDSPPPEVLRSRFVPQDPEHHIRLPSLDCRLFNYEYRLALLFWTTQNPYDRRSEWEEIIKGRVRRQNRSIQAYMSWRCNVYRRTNPRKPFASDWKFLVETIPNPPLEDPSGIRVRLNPIAAAHFNHTTHLIATWSPNAVVPQGMLPVQAVNPFSSGSVQDAVHWLPIEEPPP